MQSYTRCTKIPQSIKRRKGDLSHYSLNAQMLKKYSEKHSIMAL